MSDLIHGYVKVRISGDSKERFLNMCRMKKFRIWNLREQKETSAIVMCMAGRDLLESKNAIRKSGVKVVVLEKSGLPFFAKKLVTRAVFVGGIVFCAVFLFVMMQKIWCIQVNGNRKVTDDEMIAFLNDQEIQIGSSINHISYEKLEAQIREHFTDITWTSVVRKGTTLIIRVKENDFHNEASVYEDDTDLISEYDGVILSMVVRKGVPLVKIGDTVSKGDILVQGAVPVYDENSQISKYQYCHAQADILIQTSEHYEETISRIHDVRMYGKKVTRYEVGVGSHSIELGFSGESNQVLTKKNIHQLVLFEYLYFPVYLNVLEEIPYEIIEETYTEEEAEQILRDHLEKYLNILSEKGVQIVQKNVKIVKNGMSMQISADLILNRSAGISEKTTVELIENGETDS